MRRALVILFLKQGIEQFEQAAARSRGVHGTAVDLRQASDPDKERHGDADPHGATRQVGAPVSRGGDEASERRMVRRMELMFLLYKERH